MIYPIIIITCIIMWDWSFTVCRHTVVWMSWDKKYTIMSCNCYALWLMVGQKMSHMFFFCRVGVGVIMDQWWHLKQVYNICIDENDWVLKNRWSKLLLIMTNSELPLPLYTKPASPFTLPLPLLLLIISYWPLASSVVVDIWTMTRGPC